MACLLQNRFHIRRSKGIWRCRPSRRALRNWMLTLLVGFVCMIVALVSDQYFPLGPEFKIAGIPLLRLFAATISLVLSLAAAWIWHFRNHELVIHDVAGISLGGRLLCDSKSVDNISICRPTQPDDDDGFYIKLHLIDGRALDLNSPFFTPVGNIELTEAFAVEVADALDVQIQKDY